MNKFAGLYNIRDFKSEDFNFVAATFLKGLYHGDSWFSQIPQKIFYSNYKKVIENLLKHPKVIVKIACLKEDPDVIIGYSILSSDLKVITWVYVKFSWRNNGIGRSLVPANPTSVSHLSKTGLVLIKKFINKVDFDPFTLF